MSSRLALVTLPKENETLCGKGPRLKVPPWGKGRFFPSTMTERISSRLVAWEAETAAIKLEQLQRLRSNIIAIFAKFIMRFLVLATNLATNSSPHNLFQIYVK